MRALYRYSGEGMPHDIDRLDIQERQLLMGETQSRGSIWTDIGEAKVSHTIFGKARVRILRRQDAVRRAWRWTILGVAVAAGAVWLAWNVSQQPGISPATSPVPGAAQVVPVPMTQPGLVREAEKLPTPAVKPGTMRPAELAKLPVAQKSPVVQRSPVEDTVNSLVPGVAKPSPRSASSPAVAPVLRDPIASPPENQPAPATAVPN